jgi:hypothetical protein
LTNKDRLMVTYEGRTTECRAILINKFGTPGAIVFKGMLGGYATMMPVVTDEDGTQTDLLQGKPVIIKPYEPRLATATLAKHHSDDGLVTMREHIPLGKQYEIDLNSIRIVEFVITDKTVPESFKVHHKEVVDCTDGQYLCTEVLHIPGHTATRIYTHKDKDGVLWRFEGGRPISIIADEFMDEFGFNEKGAT